VYRMLLSWVRITTKGRGSSIRRRMAAFLLFDSLQLNSAIRSGCVAEAVACFKLLGCVDVVWGLEFIWTLKKMAFCFDAISGTVTG
jgi:hypothetical protein